MLPPLSVFIPFYNGEKYVEHTIKTTYGYLEKNFTDFELIAVDDNSSDQTRQKLIKLQKVLPKLRLIENQKGPSKRENLGKAMASARFNYVFYQDQDLSVPIEYIHPLVASLVNEHFDIAIGNRYKGLKLKRSFYRLVLSKTFNLFLRIFFKTRIEDNICGFKAFKKQMLFSLLSDMGYDNSLNRGWFWDAELLIRAQQKNMAIHEMPVEWLAGKESTFRLSKEFGLLKYICQFYKNG